MPSNRNDQNCNEKTNKQNSQGQNQSQNDNHGEPRKTSNVSNNKSEQR